ncbi:DnaD domain-containing protein [Aeribacillus pallidus]|uniref:DnaD domain-containing protein n=1 Tax=Aeribacillus pallidus TaxID=33936 RepID=UPI003D1F4837
MNSKGWISLHRKIMHNPVWSDARLLKLWIYCLLKATHKDREQLVGLQKVNLKPGQFITGRDSLEREYNEGAKPSEFVPGRTLWRWMKKLEKLEMLTIKSTSKYSVISITNWHEYQEIDQQMSSKCPANDQQMSTNNNVNNINNKFNNNNNAFEFYEKNFGLLSPFNAELLSQLIDEHSEELVLAAMKVALKRNARNLKFVETVLLNWRDAGVKTIEDARAVEAEFQRRNKFQVLKGGVVRNGQNRAKIPLHSGSHGGSSKESESISHYEPGKWDDYDLSLDDLI